MCDCSQLGHFGLLFVSTKLFRLHYYIVGVVSINLTLVCPFYAKLLVLFLSIAYSVHSVHYSGISLCACRT